MTQAFTKQMGHIPFMARFHPEIRSGVKTMTSRNKRYGNTGDYIDFGDAEGGFLRFKCVEKMSLGQVANFFWRQEGVESPEAFAEVWARIHPTAGFNPLHEVYVHTFEYVTRAELDRRNAEKKGMKADA